VAAAAEGERQGIQAMCNAKKAWSCSINRRHKGKRRIGAPKKVVSNPTIKYRET